MRSIVAFIVCSFSVVAQATFIPEHLVPKAPLVSLRSNITEREFREIISRVESAYSPIASKHGGRLTVSGDWASGTLNASARQIFSVWQVNITGGLARRSELTADGFTLILCHEVGHHLGGFAFVESPMPMVPVWAAAEGQADYFATHVCARTLWGSETAFNAQFRMTARPSVRAACDAVWVDVDRQNLCYRTVVAAESTTATMAAIMQKPTPAIETPDTSVVASTEAGHPAPQCRLDTSLQGALCSAAFNDDVIPGKGASGGEFSIEAERHAANTSCMKASQYSIGLRPNCWFNERL